MEKNLSIYIVSALVLVASVFPQTSLAYEAAPVSITKAPSFITHKDAQLNGQGNPNQIADAQQWFEWGLSGNTGKIYETPRRRLPHSYGGNRLIDSSAKIIGLAPGTQYFYRHIVESGRGKDIGQTVYFTTKPLVGDASALVIVETMAHGGIAEGSATLRGYVSPHGNTKTESWFEWGTTQQLEMQTPSRRTTGQSGYVEAKITKLTPGSLYFYRVVAQNSSGRTYGAHRVFTTLGTPPAVSEIPVAQQQPNTRVSGDGISRTTSSGSQSPQSGGGITGAGKTRTTSSNGILTRPEGSEEINSSGDRTHGFPGVNIKDQSTNFFNKIFKKKNTEESADGDVTSGDGSATNGGSGQVASVGTSGGVMGTLWGGLTGKKPVAVSAEKIGPTNIPPRSPVEYRITYRYDEKKPAENAYLSVTLPETVVYLGDNTANELIIEKGKNSERIYILPLGSISEGSTRTFTILGMTTGSADGYPDILATLSFEDENGAQLISMSDDVVAAGGAPMSGGNTAAVGKSSGGGILPNSLFEWLLYLVVIIVTIIGIRKAREYYVTRKEQLIKEDELSAAEHLLGKNFPSDTPIRA